MATVLSRLAELESDPIRTRTGEGGARAKVQGVNLGRQPKLTPEQRRETIKRRDQGEEARAKAARRYNVHSRPLSN